MQKIYERSENVIYAAAIMSAIIILISVIALLIITKNPYLDAYYIIDTFFNAPNSAATWDLAQLAITYPLGKFAVVLFIVILDNIGKLLIISFVFAAVIDIISYANLEKYISMANAKRMKGHIIICGYNKLSERLIGEIEKLKNKPRIVVIESDEENIIELHHRHIPAVEGSCSSIKALKAASVEKAKVIVFAKQNDTENIVGAIEVKKLNKKIKILIRTAKEDTMTKMYRVGVDMCVLPEYLAGISIGEFLLKYAKVQK